VAEYSAVAVPLQRPCRKKQDINKVESSGEFRLVTQKVAGEFLN